MRNTLTKRDWEMISAYLDGQLSARKQARFESRLQHDQRFQIALEEMRNTREVLRSTPKLRAPRSFMLTPEMVGQPHRLPRLAPVFGWASAVASFLFVIFLVGDLFTTGGAIPMALNNFPQQQEEFIAPKSAVAENDAPATDAAEMEAATQPMAAAPASEVIEDEIALEAAASQGDTAPVAEDVASRSVEPAEAAEETVVDQPGSEEPVEEEVEVAEIQEATPQEGLPDTSVTFGGAPLEETPEPEVTEEIEVDVVAEPEDSHEPREGVGDLEQVASVTETLPTETVTIEVPVPPLAVEALPATEELQPAEKSVPTEVPTQPIAEYQIEASAVPEPTQEVGWGFALIGASENSSEYVIGAEVILALLAVSTGLAWFYLHRRGG